MVVKSLIYGAAHIVGHLLRARAFDFPLNLREHDCLHVCRATSFGPYQFDCMSADWDLVGWAAHAGGEVGTEAADILAVWRLGCGVARGMRHADQAWR